jgi:hypothetical protein
MRDDNHLGQPGKGPVGAAPRYSAAGTARRGPVGLDDQASAEGATR